MEERAYHIIGAISQLVAILDKLGVFLGVHPKAGLKITKFLVWLLVFAGCSVWMIYGHVFPEVASVFPDPGSVPRYCRLRGTEPVSEKDIDLVDVIEVAVQTTTILTPLFIDQPEIKLSISRLPRKTSNTR